MSNSYSNHYHLNISLNLFFYNIKHNPSIKFKCFSIYLVMIFELSLVGDNVHIMVLLDNLRGVFCIYRNYITLIKK